jgi:Fur family transcriptional regulator, peroxide stress response regulator
MKTEEISTRLLEKGLKVTPQRMAVLEAIMELHNHPTAENVVDHIRKTHPHISVGTVYRILDALVENALIKKVTTERDIMRYDACLEKHHHLYASGTDRIEDYEDEELNHLIEKHLEKKGIPGFKIEDIKLQIIGKFLS